MHIEKSTSLKQLIFKSATTGLVLTSGGMMLAIAVDLPPGPVIGSLCMIMLILKRI
jgi:zinc/manganese transport system permease protein